MPENIDKDDEKFNDLLIKQHPTYESFHEAQKQDKVQDPIEKDDEKLDEMLVLQANTEKEVKYSSIEDKYEEKLIIDEVTRIISKRFDKTFSTSEGEGE